MRPSFTSFKFYIGGLGRGLTSQLHHSSLPISQKEEKEIGKD